MRFEYFSTGVEPNRPKASGAAGDRKIHRRRARADEQIGETQQRGRFGQAKIAGVDDGRARALRDEVLAARAVHGAADHEHGALNALAQAGEKFRPMTIGPILVGMRSAEPERDPGPRRARQISAPISASV